MADETIVVEVKDRIAPTIVVNLDKIAASAEKAQTAIDVLIKRTASFVYLAKQTRVLSDAVGEYSSKMTKAQTAFEKLSAAEANYIKRTNAVESSQNKTTKSLYEMQVAAEKLAATKAKLAAANAASDRINSAAVRAKEAKALSEVAVASDKAAISALRLKKAQDSLEQSTPSLVQRLWALGKSIASIWLTVQAGGKIVELADTYQVMANKLSVVTGGGEATADALERVKQIAIDTRTPIETTAQAFSRFSLAMKANGRSQEGAFRMTETVNKLLATSGATAGEAGSALLQFSQALNKGKLDGDEFRTAMELMPTAMDAIAAEMGVTRSELIKLAPEGKITADIMIRAFDRVSKDADRKFGKMRITVGQAMQNLSTEFTMAASRMLNLSGATTVVSKTIEILTAVVSPAVKLLGVMVTTLSIYVVTMKAVEIWTARATVKTVAFTAANAALNAVMKLNPYLAIITALGTMLIYMDEVVDGLSSMTRGVENFVKASYGITRVLGQNELLTKYKEDYSSLNYEERKQAEELLRQDREREALGRRMADTREELAQQHDKDLAKFTKLSRSAIEMGQSFEEFESRQGFLAGTALRNDKERSAFREQYNEQLADAAELAEKEAKMREKLKKDEERSAKAGETRAAAIAKVILELDNEIRRSTMISDEREKQAKFDQIQESLFGKRIVLTDEETRAIQGKIAAIQELKRVQSAMDQIYSDSSATLREYLAQTEAARILLDQGKITQENYSRIIYQQAAAVEMATDTFYDFNKEYEKQVEIMSFGFDVRETEIQLLEERNRLMGLGWSKAEAEAEVATIRDKAKALAELQKEDKRRLELYQLEQGYLNPSQDFSMRARALQNTNGGAAGTQAMNKAGLAKDIGLDITGTKLWVDQNIELYDQMYARIDEMRRRNLISEQDANTLMLRSRLDHQQKYLALASNFFSNFEGMQKSSSEEMAAIGKAAAIANATVQTYSSATAAYAAMAGIPVVGPALGAAAAAGAIASGMANVAAIAAQPTGFKSGGYTGDGGVNNVAGVVHGREFVFDAASTQRIGKDNLEAMRSGSGTVGSGQVEVTLNVAVVSSREEGEAALKGTSGDKMIIEVIGRNARTVKKVLQSA